MIHKLVLNAVLPQTMAVEIGTREGGRKSVHSPLIYRDLLKPLLSCKIIDALDYKYEVCSTLFLFGEYKYIDSIWHICKE